MQRSTPGDSFTERDKAHFTYTCLVNGVDDGGEWLFVIGDINHRALLTHMGKYQARACPTAIITRARGTHNISNNNHHHGNSGGNSANSSNRNDASNTTFDPSTIWLATSQTTNQTLPTTF